MFINEVHRRLQLLQQPGFKSAEQDIVYGTGFELKNEEAFENQVLGSVFPCRNRIVFYPSFELFEF
jgi:hypothetical protein